MDNTLTNFLQDQDLVFKLLERTTDGFFAVDEKWVVVYWNKAAASMLGKAKEDVVGKSLWDSFPDAKEQDYFRHYSKALQEQTPCDFEAYYPASDLWTKVHVNPFKNGLSVFFKNINDQKKAEQEIRLLSLIAKESLDAVSLLDLNGDITWVNNAFSKITGYALEEAVGNKHSTLLFGPKTDLADFAGMHQNFLQKLPFSGELQAYTKSKKVIWLSMFGQPMYNEDGEVDRFFLIQSNITEKKILQLELEEQQRLLTTATIKAQERERAEISRELHDNVNQVLTSIKLYTELCIDDPVQNASLMTRSVGLLQSCISEIRTLSKRLSAPSLGNIQIKDSIRELVENIAATQVFEVVLDADITTQVPISEELHLAIYRIVQEQLTNILKYANATLVTIFFDLVDNELMVKISDNGKGFRQGQKSGGIGLSNMATRAKSLGGSFSVNSSPGLGCVVIAMFPLA